MVTEQTYICECKATKTVTVNSKRTPEPFPETVFCGWMGCLKDAHPMPKEDVEPNE